MNLKTFEREVWNKRKDEDKQGNRCQKKAKSNGRSPGSYGSV